MTKIEVRNNTLKIEGYVNAIERPSKPLPSPQGSFREVIREKAFERALKKASDVDLLFNHQDDYRLGSIKDGSLSLIEDSVGLFAKASIQDDFVIKRAMSGALKGWSFGFYPERQNWTTDKDGSQVRYVESLSLKEISILDVEPAYQGTSFTSIEARGKDFVILEYRNGEGFKIDVIDHSFFERQIKYYELKGLKI
jgi:uncharacterized protein